MRARAPAAVLVLLVAAGCAAPAPRRRVEQQPRMPPTFTADARSFDPAPSPPRIDRVTPTEVVAGGCIGLYGGFGDDKRAIRATIGPREGVVLESEPGRVVVLVPFDQPPGVHPLCIRAGYAAAPIHYVTVLSEAEARRRARLQPPAPPPTIAIRDVRAARTGSAHPLWRLEVEGEATHPEGALVALSVLGPSDPLTATARESTLASVLVGRFRGAVHVPPGEYVLRAEVRLADQGGAIREEIRRRYWYKPRDARVAVGVEVGE